MIVANLIISLATLSLASSAKGSDDAEACSADPRKESAFVRDGGLLTAEGDFRITENSLRKGQFLAVAAERLPNGKSDETTIQPGDVIRILGPVTKPLATPSFASWGGQRVTFEIEGQNPVIFNGFANVIRGSVSVLTTPHGMSKAELTSDGEGHFKFKSDGSKGVKIQLQLGEDVTLNLQDHDSREPFVELPLKDGIEGFSTTCEEQKARLDTKRKELEDVVADEPKFQPTGREEEFVLQSRRFEHYAYARTIRQNADPRNRKEMASARQAAAKVLLGESHFAEGMKNFNQHIQLARNVNDRNALSKIGLKPNSLFPDQQRDLAEIQHMLAAVGRNRSQDEQRTLATAAARVESKRLSGKSI